MTDPDSGVGITTTYADGFLYGLLVSERLSSDAVGIVMRLP